MDAFRTHGAPSWVELTTTDHQAAAAFYGDLFGWKIQSMGMEGGEYRATIAVESLPPAS